MADTNESQGFSDDVHRRLEQVEQEQETRPVPDANAVLVILIYMFDHLYRRACDEPDF